MDNVFANMKTGLSDAKRTLPPDFVKRLYSIVATIGSLSLVTSAQYAEHSNRDYVTDTDMKYAWMHLARTFLDREHLEEEIQNTENEIYNIEDTCVVCDAALPEEYFECSEDCGRFYCSEACAETDEDHECGEDDEEEEKEFTRSTCNCPQCSDIHRHVDTWDTWQPKDAIEAFMKYRLVDAFLSRDS
jgi:hypothetical protein